MTITERAESARKELLDTTRGTEYTDLILRTLALTMAEGWDNGYEQGYDSGLGVYAHLFAKEANDANVSTVR